MRAGVGVDNIDLAAATREGIVVMNTPAGNTTSTAEHTIAMLLALSRNIAPAAASMKAGKWDRKSYTGTQLAGKTLAVVGLGRIGLAVAKRAIGLEMKVIGYDPFLSAERAAEHGIEVVRAVDDLIERCDFLTVHTPLTEETKGLINASRLARMRKGVRIINCARGGIVDEAALRTPWKAGKSPGPRSTSSRRNRRRPINPLVVPSQGRRHAPLRRLDRGGPGGRGRGGRPAADRFFRRGQVRFSVNLPDLNRAELRRPAACTWSWAAGSVCSTPRWTVARASGQALRDRGEVVPTRIPG